MSKYTITDDSQLTTLDAQLKDNLFIGGGFPNAEDALVYEQFVSAKSEPNQATHLNLWSWFNLVVLFQDFVRQQWKQVAPAQEKKSAAVKEAAPKKEEPKQEAPKQEAPKDECDDLFGDDDDSDAAAKLEELKKKKELAQAEKPKKAGPIAKSLIIVDVKVWETDQDLDALAARIIAIEKDGLFWKTEYKLAEVAFGVKKIVIGLVVEDEKVSIDDIIDELQGWEDDIQSVDIVSFNKI